MALPFDPRQLGGRPGSRGAWGVSPNRFPGSRSAGGPVFPAGTGVVLVPVAPPMPPPMPVLAPAGPYEQEKILGDVAMVQTTNTSFPVGLASVILLQRNTSRKGMSISNPSTTLTVFLDFGEGPASALSFPLFPLGSIQFWAGEKQYIPKDRVFAIASGAGPTLVQVLEFS